MTRFVLLLTLLAAAGCRSDVPETGRAQSAEVGDSEPDTMAGSVEYEAPRLIPGMRAQLTALADTAGGLTEGNVTAYKNLAGDLVHAMLADLNRVGSSDVDQFRALGDSVLDLVGGGTGVPDAGREDIARSIEGMQRLIDRYQEQMRAARS